MPTGWIAIQAIELAWIHWDVDGATSSACNVHARHGGARSDPLCAIAVRMMNVTR
ncbi:MAG: hypothetical protein ACYCRH_05525 [Acidiferrobacteraceae bacterium]